jgi:molybdopterin converting factor small subunit
LAKIKVRLFFDLIPSSGKSELEVEASDLNGLLDSMSRRMGDAFRAPLYDSHGRPRPYSMVYHNGTGQLLESASNFALKDGDTVLFVPAVGGG